MRTISIIILTFLTMFGGAISAFAQEASCVISIAVDGNASAEHGDIILRITEKNHSNHNIRVSHILGSTHRAELAYLINVWYDGRPAHRTKLGDDVYSGRDKAFDDIEVVGTYLGPLQENHYETHLNALYDMSNPGKYLVQVVEDPGLSSATKSNLIEVTVVK